MPNSKAPKHLPDVFPLFVEHFFFVHSHTASVGTRGVRSEPLVIVCGGKFKLEYHWMVIRVELPKLVVLVRIARVRIS